MRRLCRGSRGVPTWVTLSQHRAALQACMAQSWETWEALERQGSGDGGSSCWAFLLGLQVAWGGGKGWVARQAPLLIPAASGSGRVPSLCPICYMLLATNSFLHLAAIFRGQRKRSARGGWPLCKVVGSLPVWDRHVLAPRAWRGHSLGGAPAPALRHRAGCPVSPLPGPLLQLAPARYLPAGSGSGPEGLICFNVWL